MKLQTAHISMLIALISHLEANRVIGEMGDLFEYIYQFMYAILKHTQPKMKGILPHYLTTLVRLTTCFSESGNQNTVFRHSNLRPRACDFANIVRLYESLPALTKKHAPSMIASLLGMQLPFFLKAQWKHIIMNLMDVADEHGRGVVMTLEHYRPLLKALWKEWENEHRYVGRS